jgi:hypothetical protein
MVRLLGFSLVKFLIFEQSKYSSHLTKQMTFKIKCAHILHITLHTPKYLMKNKIVFICLSYIPYETESTWSPPSSCVANGPCTMCDFTEEVIYHYIEETHITEEEKNRKERNSTYKCFMW